MIQDWFSLPTESSQSRKWSDKNTYDLVKITNRRCKRSHKHDRIGVRRIKMCPFLQTPLTTLSLTFHLWCSENQIVGARSRSGKINQSQCTFPPRFVIGLVLLLLLLTLTIWFSLDQKQNLSDGVIRGIGTLFSLEHKLYASNYNSDSDSDTSENQPLKVAHPHGDYSFALFLVKFEFGNVGSEERGNQRTWR